MDLPDEGLPEEELGRRIGEARQKDTPFLSGHVLGSMCTAPHPAGLQAWQVFADANLGDPLINPGAAELEDEVVDVLCSIAGGGPEADGLFVSGGTEANVTALRLARDRTGRDEVVMPETAHFSFEKAAHALGLTVTRTPVTDGFAADVEAMNEAVTEDTACVVGVAGNTEFGAVDDIPAIAEIGDDVGAWTHVDAAYGGFVLPFLPDGDPFGLDVDGVDSVTIDPHKMGRAPVPAGGLLVDHEDKLSPGATETPYVSTDEQAGLLSTRPGAAAAGAWASMHALGQDGYQTQARAAVEVAEWFAGVLENKGASLARDPSLGILAIEVDHNEQVRAQLAEKGWKVSLTTLVPGIRIVCMPHVTAERLTEFARELPNRLEVDDGRILRA
jgi:tyrosine decarboxylase/aspartate 1-decarboxylase